MVLRMLRQPGVIKISKPGIDVSTAAEKDLLIALGARNCQVIQRGFIAAPAPTPSGNDGIFNFTIAFPAQSTKPDLRVEPIRQASPNQRSENHAFTNDNTTISVVFGTSSIAVQLRNSINQFTGLQGISYVLLRKRTDS
ncbi:hypothetical protein [Methylobacterium brachythecii]|uniref:Uncharacterized protein n=1 Tax=Methylobacterium brachythecii TaxID=1176177 RepID=A0A7W6AQU6_9HYPH|nr:hypothetical protein [Methylobacterium brachythecii]MBB3904172.1 hypothetical protein [Methylobacterium brachythecii]GLS45166.1 hypothetical protein GCM10007884_31550 [Methylobacterium brachythecii]